LKALKAEVELIRQSLGQLSNNLLHANLEHTNSHFYDSDVRRVSDQLVGKLNAVDALLYMESRRHRAVGEEVEV
jgi:hypothetical protein